MKKRREKMAKGKQGERFGTDPPLCLLKEHSLMDTPTRLLTFSPRR